MSVARRFTFDLDLAAPAMAARHAEPSVSQPEIDARVEAARAEGYEQGLAEGLRDARAKSTSALTKAANAIAIQTADFVTSLEGRRAELLSDTTALALAIAGRLATHLLARHPQGELEALIGEALASIDHAPHLVIRCHPDLTDVLKKAAEDRMRTSGFTGRLVVMGDPEIQLGDGRLEWVDGGLVRDSAAIVAAIDDRIATYLAAHGIASNEESQ